MTPLSRSLLLMTIALAGIVLFAEDAEAKRRGGFVLINTGAEVTEVASIPDESSALVHEVTGLDPKLGYTYSRFGIFFLDLWRWDGEWCLVSGDNVWLLTEAEATQLMGESPNVPFSYRVPPGLWVLALLIIGGIAFKRMRD